jgi:16S rRNA G966 N2-methylase RsmD
MKNKNLTPKLKEKYLKYIFNDYDETKKYKMDEVSIYSVTPQEYADKISILIKDYFKSNDIVITDLMACIGGNSISFCKTFKKVNSIELSKNRFDFLVHNLKICGFQNFVVYNSNCLRKINELKQDVIFIDPEWGGRDYKYKKNVDLFISKKPLYDICNSFKNKCKLQVLKLPNNFDFIKFKKHTKCKIFHMYDMKKFKLMFLV